MSIVIITIPGEAKAAFARELHAASGGGVRLVIVQKQRKCGILLRSLRFLSAVKTSKLPKEILSGLLLRFDPAVREKLEYFRAFSTGKPKGRVPRTIEVDSVNDDEIYKKLLLLAPDLLVVWGSTILEPRIVHCAKRAINLHMGYCPHYRGALANQHAVLRGDYSRIGATIHYINGEPDAGDILETIEADASKNPSELLLDVNNRAFRKYVEVACRLAAGEDPPAAKQDHAGSNVLFLREWTPSLRYSLGRKIINWELEKKAASRWAPAPMLEAKSR